MEKLFYPAIFQEENVGGYSIFFPDVEGCYTQAENMEDGYKMAVEALEDNKIELPKASTPNNIKMEKDQFVIVIEFEMLEYKRKNESKSVKKTLTIPSWLNEIAIEQNINFSQVLQEALMNKVNI